MGKSKDRPLVGDPARQAADSMRGYAYQIWRSVHAWLELGDDECLFLEGAEDFDRVGNADVTATQVKDTKASGNITLRSKNTLSSIANFWDLCKKNPGRIILYRYITTSGIGVERGKPFGAGQSGIKVWQRCRESRNEDAALTDAAAIGDFLAKIPKVPTDLREFLNAASPSDIRQRLIMPVEWDTNANGTKAVIKAIDRKLIYHGDRLQVPPSEAKGAKNRLYRTAWDVATRANVRFLDRAFFLELFEEETVVTLTRSQFGALVPQEFQSNPQRFTVLFKSQGEQQTTIKLTSSTLTGGDPPPLPVRLFKRDTLASEASRMTDKTGFLLIKGSTGMGKTTLARVLVSSWGRTWHWLDVRGRTATDLRPILEQVGNCIDLSRDVTNLVIDDLDFSSDIRSYDSALAGLLYTIQSRRGRILIVGSHDMPQRLRLKLDLPTGQVFEVPPFSQAEIKAFLIQRGCEDTQRAEVWSHILLGTTGGHPQLVNARLQSLETNNFPEPRIHDLVDIPLDIQEARSEARSIISEGLNNRERELLYRLSVTIQPFRRDHALAIAGKLEPIEHPGEAFDTLVGPWLERVNTNYYRKSPLVTNAGKEVYGEQWETRMHSEISEAVGASRELTTSDAAGIFFHALVGKNEKLLAHLTGSLLQADKEILRSFATQTPMLMFFGVASGTSLPIEDSFTRFTVRMLQYRAAAEVAPKEAPTIFARIDKEFPASVSDLKGKLTRQFLLGQVLLGTNVNYPIEKLTSWMVEFVTLTDEIKRDNKEFSELFDHLPLVEQDGVYDFATETWVFIYLRFKTIDDFLGFFHALSDIGPDLRNRLLWRFQKGDWLAGHFFDTAWLTEYKKSRPRWKEFIDRCEQIYRIGRDWDLIPLAHASASMMARVVDENLENPDKASEILDKCISEIGEWKELADARARILHRSGKYREALSIWERILPTWNAAEIPSADLTPVFACRNAGICAAKLGNWTTAADFFLQGWKRAHDVSIVSYRIGLLADSAYAFWKAEVYDQAISYFDKALQELEDIPNTADDVHAFRLHKVIGHVMMWVSITSEGESPPDSSEPPPGCCSNSDVDESIGELNMTPIDYSWHNLLRFEFETTQGTSRFDRVVSRLKQSKYPFVRLIISRLILDKSFRNLQLNDLIYEGAGLVQGLSDSKNQDQAGIPLWEEEKSRQTHKDLTDPEVTEIMQCYLLIGLLALSARGRLTKKIVRTWKKSAKVGGIGASLSNWLDTAWNLLFDKPHKAAAIMKDVQQPSSYRMLAALAVVRNDDSSPPDVFQAHALWLYGLQVGSFTKTMADDIAALVEKDWRRLAGRPFLLTNPRSTVPAILAECDAGKRGWAKIAGILLAAYTGVRVGVPDDFLPNLKRLADGP